MNQGFKIILIKHHRKPGKGQRQIQVLISYTSKENNVIASYLIRSLQKQSNHEDDYLKCSLLLFLMTNSSIKSVPLDSN